MALIKFEVTDNHLKLLRQLRFHKDGDHLTSGDRGVDELVGTPSPYGGDSTVDDMGLIIFGPPKGFNPMESDSFGWSQEQLEEIEKLKGGVPTALDICLSTGKFEAGHYKRKSYERNWTKYDPK